MSCVEKISHSCGSSDGLQVFTNEDGSFSGYCFSCSSYVGDPYGGNQPDPGELKPARDWGADIKEIGDYPVVDLPSRKLREKYLRGFGVTLGMSQSDGTTPKVRYYPIRKDGVVIGYKAKLVDKKVMWTIGNSSGCDLFGWEEAAASGAKRLIITEGEDDAIAIQAIFDLCQKEEYKDYTPASCSLVHGVSSAAKEVARAAKKIKDRGFEVVLCFDDDEPGRKATEEVCKILPEAISVKLPCKDANECIIQGRAKAAFNCLAFRASKPSNSKLVWLDSVWIKAREKAVFGVSWPWEWLTTRTRGIRKGETYYIGAGTKMGKSELLNAIAAHLLKAHLWKLFLAKPEESNIKTAKMLASKVVSSVFHDPNVDFDYGKFDQAGEALLGNRVCLLNLYQHMGWDSLKQDIIEAKSHGIDAVFIDPITNLTNGVDAGDANTELQTISQEIAAMSKDLDIATFLFCHLRNPSSGPEHNRGGKVLSGQFAGSRAMARSCNYMLGMEGNKDPELAPEERNVRRIVLLEDREYGETGEMDLSWDRRTTQFTEVQL